jgi:hypothetical protein
LPASMIAAIECMTGMLPEFVRRKLSTASVTVLRRP